MLGSELTFSENSIATFNPVLPENVEEAFGSSYFSVQRASRFSSGKSVFKSGSVSEWES
ncbi:hypothetical protein COLO4_35680 [Corchorus olitorius]|uniref:Uncharacterized protein n=1 Tax=Corchorus olitorius TaxID=93759 RepID=A0A1R3GE52_9ROSI|nr:hypothetical protein COLO4_35680 [Corchorus olitorius]